MEMGEHQNGLPELHHYGMVLMGGEGAGGGDQMVNEAHALQTHHILQLPPLLPQPQIRMDPLGAYFDDGNGCSGFSQGRWPRQETLTLLEIRSRLDHKFKEAAHKAPLWDEVSSRIMAEEYGYQRSGKKCREKLENLYKYYKKTKEGRAGRQDGKHYRFFRQLEALYGASSSSLNARENAIINSYSPIFHITATTQFEQEGIHRENYTSFSNSSEFCTSSEEYDGDEDLCAMEFAGNVERQGTKKDVGRSLKRGRKGWRSKIKEFVDLQLRRFMEMQGAWLETMLKTLEHKEQEWMTREEEWRRREAARLDRESENWAKERAWIEARDTALIEALEKISRGGRVTKIPTLEDQSSMDAIEGNNANNNINEQDGVSSRRWPEPEITSLIKLRTAMEARFREGGCPKMALWDEISAGMAAMGYERSAKRCKEKWENINKYFRKTKECNKKRRENSKTCPYYKHLDALYSQGRLDGDEQHEPSPSSSNIGTVGRDGCYHMMMDGGESLWESQVEHTSGDKEVERP